MNDEYNNNESQNLDNDNNQLQNGDNKSGSTYQLSKQDLDRLNQTYSGSESGNENPSGNPESGFGNENPRGNFKSEFGNENPSGNPEFGFGNENPNGNSEFGFGSENPRGKSESGSENPNGNKDNFNGKKPVKIKKEHKFLKKIGIVAMAGLIVGIVGATSLLTYNYFANGSGKSSFSENDLLVEEDIKNEGKSNSDAVAVNTQGKVTSDVSEVVDNVMPSIVAINSVANNVTSDFFGRQYSQQVEESGSGIIIGQNNSEILIATNNHVIAGATKVDIVFDDKSTASAKVKGTAPSSDLAVVSVDINSLNKDTINNIKIATLGNSDNVKLGEMAIAIGNALGYGQSVTVGYISALNREVNIEGVDLNLIQTDAAINPGNSGGALLNSKGEVIGINSVKLVDEKVEGIGYAIPISAAIPIINNLMNRTTLVEKDRAYLGVSGKDVTDVYSQAFGMPVGFYVGEVEKGSAAEKAGINVGDIIVAINDINIETKQELKDTLTYTKGGSKGTITVKSLVNGEYKEKVLEITFDKR